MKKKGLYILILAAVMLTGCGRKPVTYNSEEDSPGVNGEVITEAAENGTLQGSLNAPEKWEETINTDGGGSITIRADVIVPQVTAVATAEVTEYYYTAEDKKKIVESLFDEGSQLVDVDAVITKERLRTEIGEWDEIIRLISEDTLETEEYSARKVTVAENEKERLKNLLVEAPELNEIKEEVGDYSQDYYKGTRDGYNYCLSFDIDKERNRSSWMLSVAQEDLSKMNAAGVSSWLIGNMTAGNHSAMTQEEAEQKALSICQELGFRDMAQAWIYNLNWGGHYEGYYVFLTRKVGDVPVDNAYYMSLPGTSTTDIPSSYLDTQQTMPPYEREGIGIALTDRGIVAIECTGIMSGGEEEAVKVLGFEQIQESIRTQIKQMASTTSQSFVNMELIYIRIQNDTDGNSYRYIPAWRLLNNVNSINVSKRTLYIDTLLVNAIDGSFIDPVEEVDLRIYNTPEMLKEEYMFLEE